ncbi:hypothetical protein JQK87_35135 [Streptomyces sp. G44]|uniref:hypothetical protein n=1 Tax=Streptomyces sp. G44 TaxID=2807632 RepID=UPI00195F65A2|nr:hypothetical protein [Streptomyces sp. G44]MBM7173532.1 hypothetical protein [Streptomyces sp. G44]
MVLGSNPRRATYDGRRGTRRARGAALAAAAALLIGPAAVACGDDSGGGDGGTPPEPSVQRTSEPAGDAATAPADPKTAEKEVRENWEKFFDPEVSLKDKEAVLENGAEMRAVLAGFSGDERGKQVAAKVGGVEFTSAEEADVTYALTLKGATALPDASGTAVNQDGTWKVSVKTLCALVKMSGHASPGPGC